MLKKILPVAGFFLRLYFGLVPHCFICMSVIRHVKSVYSYVMPNSFRHLSYHCLIMPKKFG